MPHRISASIRPHMLDVVVDALHDVGLLELVAVEARGFTGRARHSVYRGVPHLALEDRILLDVVTHAHPADLVAQLIVANARTGYTGDGSVWSSPLDVTVDVLTGHRDVTTR